MNNINISSVNKKKRKILWKVMTTLIYHLVKVVISAGIDSLGSETNEGHSYWEGREVEKVLEIG